MNQVTFKSDFFKPIEGEDKETNPGCYGKALATWVAEKLRTRGVSVESVLAEDWGWLVMVSRNPFLLWLGCGNVDGSPGEWRVFVEAEPSLIQRLFKNVNTVPAKAELEQHLAELVQTIPGVSEIVWD
jgi:hypothetical protein